MRRVTACALVTVMASGALVGLAGPSTASAPASPIDPVVKVVQTAAGDAGQLLCEVLGNIVTC